MPTEHILNTSKYKNQSINPVERRYLLVSQLYDISRYRTSSTGWSPYGGLAVSDSEGGRVEESLTGLLLLDRLDGDRLPAGGGVDGHLLKLRVGEAVQDAPDVLVDLEALQQRRLAAAHGVAASRHGTRGRDTARGGVSRGGGVTARHEGAQHGTGRGVTGRRDTARGGGGASRHEGAPHGTGRGVTGRRDTARGGVSRGGATRHGAVAGRHGTRGRNTARGGVSRGGATRHGTGRGVTGRRDTARGGATWHGAAAGRHGTRGRNTARHVKTRHGTAPHGTRGRDTARGAATRHKGAQHGTNKSRRSGTITLENNNIVENNVNILGKWSTTI